MNTTPFHTPFHAGEIELQRRAGVHEQVASFAQRSIRPFMPDQHREFFATLPFVVLGVVDAQGRPWASLFCGPAGFVQSPSPTELHIRSAPVSAAPLRAGLQDGAAVGLLGIELLTRRRNRANGVINTQGNAGFVVQVRESFGNCPKYIQTRHIEWRETVAEPREEKLEELTAEALNLIRGADTFFVASYIDGDDGQRRVDVSHRGGKPGFVGLEPDGSLLVPDFIGNNMFCTLGNMLQNPRAGLVFVDFETGNLLHLSGQTELLWEGDEVGRYSGARHAWRFHFKEGFWLRSALPFAAHFHDASPFLEGLGPKWRQAG